MHKVLLLFILLLVIKNGAAQNQDSFVLVIHGGAGTILKSSMTPEKEAAYKAGLTAALEKGYAVLKNNGTALDAVTEAVKVLEDNPLFNAGKGAVFTNAGTNEMDAAIMDGKTKAAGSVAGVSTIKNPITAARAVMEKSEHVMLTGKGAEQFAAANNCTIVDPSYFFTQERWDALQQVKVEDSINQQIKKRTRIMKDSVIKNLPVAYKESPEYHTSKFGTVGAVALDKNGNLAAATSTGGMTNKKWGRVGDAPIIGAGTYADNATCAVSCTGWGEYFIRAVVAKTISDQIKYAGLPVAKAAQNSLDEVAKLGGDGGLIALDKTGNYTMSFNTEGMYRGVVKADGKITVYIYK
ncbi:isoaspartyl peptidase/L-asparaginase [soil metagenome]